MASPDAEKSIKTVTLTAWQSGNGITVAVNDGNEYMVGWRELATTTNRAEVRNGLTKHYGELVGSAVFGMVIAALGSTIDAIA